MNEGAVSQLVTHDHVKPCFKNHLTSPKNTILWASNVYLAAGQRSNVMSPCLNKVMYIDGDERQFSLLGEISGSEWQ